MKRAGRIPVVKHELKYYAERYVNAGYRKDTARKQGWELLAQAHRRRQEKWLRGALEVGYSRQEFAEAVRDIELGFD